MVGQLRKPVLPALFLCSLAVHGQQAMRFIENRGQWPEQVTHRAELPGATIWCEGNAVLIDRYDAHTVNACHGDINCTPPATLRHHAVRMRFLSATGTSRNTGELPLPGHHSYFIGHDPQRWAGGAKAYAAVTMHQVAPGCDARFREGNAGLKYDLVVAPGADPAAIRFAYEGADAIELRDGVLVINTSLGRLVERIPLAYQDIDGERRTVPCSYTLHKGVVGVKPGRYDPRHPLIIDPELAFATFSGSVSNNFGYTATFDKLGFLYSGSTAFGAQYPVTLGAYQTAWAGGGTDIALTKYDTTGSFLVWSTYIGGSAAEMPHSLIVDDNDELVMLGTTGSANFPTTPNAYDGTFAGGSAFTPAGLGLSYAQGCDMVVVRLNPTGTVLVGSTYLGGSANDGLNSAPGLRFNYADEVRGEVLLNDAGEVWVVSCTQSTNIPTTPGAAQTVFGGGSHDGYVARLSPAMDQLLYASFVGGSGADAAFAGELDAQQRLYVCGGTNSTDLPTTPNAVHPAFNGGSVDAFAARFNASGTQIEAMTYWGSDAYDQAYFVELDSDANVYLFGQTAAPAGQLIANASYVVDHGGQFITKLDADLGALLLSTRIGSGDGTPDISPTAFLVDVCDKIYTSGWGSSAGGLGGSLTTAGLPVTPDAHQPTTDGHDLYLAVFDIDMSALLYATYYGGGVSPEHVDGGTSRFDRRGRVYQSVCAGCQGNSDFPTTPGAWSSTNNSGFCNNGVLKFDFDAPLVIAAFMVSDTICGPFAVPFSNLSSSGASYLWDFGDGTSSTQHSPVHTFPGPGTYTVTLTATDPLTCNEVDVAVRTVHVHAPAPVLQVMSDTLVCGPIDAFTLRADAAGTATTFIWSGSAAFTDPLNPPQDSTATITSSGTYYVMVSNGSPCVAVDSVHVVVSNGDIRLTGDTLNCATDTARLVVTGADPGSSFLWEPDEGIVSGQGTAALSVIPTDNTTYAVQVSSPTGCTWSASVPVLVSPINGAAATATVDQGLVLPATTVQLNATPTSGVTYSWSPPTLVSDPQIADPTAVVYTTTTFTVTVSDGVCTRSASVTVRVHELVCGEPDIFVPNTFTPNGDGHNDVLYVRGRMIERMTFQVFDRWGEKVFETDDPHIGWDGTYKGRPVDPAVFVYHLTAWCVDGQKYFTKGNVTVVR
jgi:gliding motility-associated-like protein